MREYSLITQRAFILYRSFSICSDSATGYLTISQRYFAITKYFDIDISLKQNIFVYTNILMTTFDLSCYDKITDINLEDLTVKEGYSDQEKWNLAEKAAVRIYKYNQKEYKLDYRKFSLETFILPKVQKIIDDFTKTFLEAIFLMDIENQKLTLRFRDVKTFQYVEFSTSEQEKIKHLIKLFYDRYANRSLCAVYIPNLSTNLMPEDWLVSMIPLLLTYIPKEYKYVYSRTYDPKNIYLQLPDGVSKYNDGYIDVITKVGTILTERAEELYKFGYIKLGKEEYYNNIKDVATRWELEIVDPEAERLYDDTVVEKCCRYYRPAWMDYNITKDPVLFIQQRITGYDHIQFYVPNEYTIKHFVYKLLQEMHYIPDTFIDDIYFGNSFLTLPVEDLKSAQEIWSIIEYATTMSEGFNLVIPFDDYETAEDIYKNILRDIPEVNFCLYTDRTIENKFVKSGKEEYEQGPYILSAIISLNLKDTNRLLYQIRKYVLEEYYTGTIATLKDKQIEATRKIRSPRMLPAPVAKRKSSGRKIYREYFFPRQREKIKIPKVTTKRKKIKRQSTL